ncbi:MAG: adenylate/guanylate cyclase domain-containing protein [Candidatus Manganitrophaceae bacterium]
MLNRLNLKVKFSLLVGTLIGAALTTLVLIATTLMSDSLSEEATLRAVTIAQGIARYSQEPILTRDRLALETMVNEASKDPAVLYISIVDLNQNILAHTDMSQQGKPYFPRKGKEEQELKGGISITAAREPDGREYLNLTAPILFTGQKEIGSVHIGFSKRPINETITESRWRIMTYSLFFIVVSLIGTWLVTYLFMKPIHGLLQGVKSITEGRYPEITYKSNDEIGQLVQDFNVMSQSLKERDLIKRAFSQYVSGNVLEKFLENPDQQLGGTRTEATILFTDIRDFTPLAERLEPSEVVRILNDYFAAVVEVVEKYEGTLDKFIGDAVMAVFGTPVSHHNDEERAVRAALEMKQKFQELKQKWLRENYPEIRIGIGINTGEVIAGNVGSLKRLAYTVIGNSVNMAARIEKLNKRYHTEILISAETYRRLEEILDVFPLPPARIRGKSEEIQVYAVSGFKNERAYRQRLASA